MPGEGAQPVAGEQSSGPARAVAQPVPPNLLQVQVGGGCFAHVRPPEPTYSITQTEYKIIRRGEEQSTDQNLFINALCVGISTLAGLIALACSVSYEVDGKANWRPINASLFLALITVASFLFAGLCKAREKKAKEDDLYSSTVAKIDRVLCPQPLTPASIPTDPAAPDHEP